MMQLAVQWWRVGCAWLVLFPLQWALRRKGFQGVFPQWVRRFVSNRRVSAKGLDQRSVLWLQAIDIACRLVPWEARCLHRSFLGYLFLRRRLGLPVEMVIGVTKFPFSAHAWLELGGEAVNETPAFIRPFAVLLRSDQWRAS